MAILADWRQRKNLRLNFVFKIEHDADDPRPVARHAYRLDMRIVGTQPPHKLPELAVRLDTFEIEHQALRILEQHHLMRDRRR